MGDDVLGRLGQHERHPGAALDPEAAQAGGEAIGQVGSLDELDRFRGRPRVWLIVTHALPDLAEAPLILGYLDAIGTRRAVHRGSDRVRPGSLAAAAGDLYDLSDPARLGRASAATYALPARSPSAAGAWSC